MFFMDEKSALHYIDKVGGKEIRLDLDTLCCAIRSRRLFGFLQSENLDLQGLQGTLNEIRALEFLVASQKYESEVDEYINTAFFLADYVCKLRCKNCSEDLGTIALLCRAAISIEAIVQEFGIKIAYCVRKVRDGLAARELFFPPEAFDAAMIYTAYFLYGTEEAVHKMDFTDEKSEEIQKVLLQLVELIESISIDSLMLSQIDCYFNLLTTISYI